MQKREMEQSPTQPPAKKIKKQKCYRQKVEKEWLQNDTLKLIQEIGRRRSLWDIGCPGYKLPKEFLWQQVADSIPMPVGECKGKWANLRTTFNSNLKKKSGQDLNEIASITWKYFKKMLFLQASKDPQSNQTTSIKLESAVDDFEYDVPETSSPSIDESSIEKQVKDYPPLRSYSLVSQSESSFKQTAIEALQSICSIASKPKNASTALCEYMDLELNNLTPHQATYARSKLRHAFNEIMNEVALVPSPHFSSNDLKDS